MERLVVSSASCGHPRDWHGCYKGQFDLWVDDAMAHPAKMSPALCFRIIQHLEELGLLEKGRDQILDPLAGIATTGLCAALKGYPSVMVELEEKFVKMAEKNAERLTQKGFESPIQILQGDARQLSQLLQEKGLVALMSPPYLAPKRGGGIAQEGYTKAYQEGKIGGGNLDPVGQRTYMPETIGSTPGQIGALPDKPLKALLSPPFGDMNHPTNYLGKQKRESCQEYSNDPDNIGNLPDRPLKALTSPPYESDMQTGGGIDWGEANRPDRRIEVNPVTRKAYTRHNIYGVNTGGYGQAEGQIGREQGGDINAISNIIAGNLNKPSYLSEMFRVYAEIARVADVLVVVTKNPTRVGKLRDLCGDTQKLLEACGWEIKCHHHALLFEELEQATLDGKTKKQVKGRLSFFKRLAYRKGAIVAGHEDVLIYTREGG